MLGVTWKKHFCDHERLQNEGQDHGVTILGVTLQLAFVTPKGYKMNVNGTESIINV